jgi:hypothetical protein
MDWPKQFQDNTCCLNTTSVVEKQSQHYQLLENKNSSLIAMREWAQKNVHNYRYDRACEQKMKLFSHKIVPINQKEREKKR